MKALVFVILFSLFFPTASATIIHFQPATLNIEAGTQRTVEILVEPTEPIDTVATDYISWDPSIVDCVGIQRGGLFNDTTIWIPGTIDKNKGEIRNMVWASVTPTDDSGVFVVLTFYGKKDGTTSITINESECGIARAGKDISKTLFNACSITVTGDIAILPTGLQPEFILFIGALFILVVIILLVLIFRKKK